MQAVYADGITRDVTTQGETQPGKSAAGATEQRGHFPNLCRCIGVAHHVCGLHESGSGFRDERNRAKPVSFTRDVMPVFTKAGCNTGACHGTSRGKDGFHLSLFGFDPDGDYFRLTREQIGRRVNLAIPTESLIVQKGLGAVQHTGGVRFTTNSALYHTLVAWLEAGAKADPTNVAKLTGVEIFRSRRCWKVPTRCSDSSSARATRMGRSAT